MQRPSQLSQDQLVVAQARLPLRQVSRRGLRQLHTRRFLIMETATGMALRLLRSTMAEVVAKEGAVVDILLLRVSPGAMGRVELEAAELREGEEGEEEGNLLSRPLLEGTGTTSITLSCWLSDLR